MPTPVITFARAVRKPSSLLIGLAGASGSGKTWSAMELATGLAGDKPFAVIDVENGRATHYAKFFTFDHGDLGPPYTPGRYEQSVKAAVAAGYKAIVVDQLSYEQAGEGGLNEWHEAELDRMAGDNWGKRQACNLAAWIAPKVAHKAMMRTLETLPLDVHVVLCLRAEEKIEMVDDPDKPGKKIVRAKKSASGLDGWIPTSEKTVPYALTMSLLLTPEEPGLPRPIKLQEQHRPFFPKGAKISREMGEKLREWAAGGDAPLSPEDVVAELLAAYEICETEAEFQDLEKRRAELWPSAKRDKKEALATAKSHAADRVEAMKGV